MLVNSNERELTAPRPEVNRSQSSLTTIARLALEDVCGSGKAAALTLEMDPGQYAREMQTDGVRLGRLDRLSPQERAAVVDRLYEEFGSAATDPKAQARRLIREIRRRCDELEEFVA